MPLWVAHCRQQCSCHAVPLLCGQEAVQGASPYTDEDLGEKILSDDQTNRIELTEVQAIRTKDYLGDELL